MSHRRAKVEVCVNVCKVVLYIVGESMAGNMSGCEVGVCGETVRG